jgi:PAS domain S-box-containing protein
MILSIIIVTAISISVILFNNPVLASFYAIPVLLSSRKSKNLNSFYISFISSLILFLIIYFLYNYSLSNSLSTTGIIFSFLVIVSFLFIETRTAERTETISKLKFDLNERVKELNLLYKITGIIQKTGNSRDEILQKAADMIPEGWQYPEATVAKISVKDKDYTSLNYRQPVSKIEKEFITSSGIQCSIEVGYVEEKKDEDSGPFLEFELKLLNFLKEILKSYLDRNESYEALKESEAKYRNLIMHEPVSHSRFLLKEKRYEFFNNEFLKQTGYTFEEFEKLNKKELIKMVHKDDRKIVFEKYRKWSGQGFEGIQHFLFRIINKSKEVIWLNANLYPDKNESGEVIAINQICLDITDLIIAKEKAEELNRMKTDFLAQMSHEIRTPLNILMNYSSMIMIEIGDKVSKNTEKIFESIEISGKRLLRSIDLLLNMTDVQTGEFIPDKKTINLYTTLKSLIKEFDVLIKQKKLKVKLIKKTGKFIIESDEYSINQIFQNLLDNAIKYTPKGSIEIKIDENEKKEITVSFKDSGIGISKEFVPKLFSPFSQESSGTSRKYEGNGLGLALVKKYSELNNIDIGVVSEKNSGSTFTLTIRNQN